MTIIEVNIQDAASTLASLIEKVRDSGTWVRICKDGKVLADLRPAASVANPLLQDADLSAVAFNEDPMTPLSSEDWPVESR